MTTIRTLLFALVCIGTAASVSAEEAQIAVAANFSAPMKQILSDFERTTGHQIRASYGSTGKLYAQIQNGAPFEALLAADQERPRRLEDEGAGVLDSRFTYAIGTLVLWSADPNFVDDQSDVLSEGDFDKLAIANPKLAPYGLAAEQTLAALGLLETLKDRLVFGENVGQTFALAASGNVTAAFVAASQVATLKPGEAGHAAPIPDDMHDPIRQDGVLTARGAGNQAARDFLGFMKGPAAGGVIARYGYGKASE